MEEGGEGEAAAEGDAEATEEAAAEGEEKSEEKKKTEKKDKGKKGPGRIDMLQGESFFVKKIFKKDKPENEKQDINNVERIG